MKAVMSFPVRFRTNSLMFGLCLALVGCNREPVEDPVAGPLTVSVSYPIEREVTDYADFTGRTAAVESVEVRARVWGFLDKVNFKEGALVEKGDVLLEIDPRTYQAALAQAEGNLASGTAKLKRLDAELIRAEELLRTRAISKSDFDKAIGDRNEAAASLDALKAAVEQAKLDVGFTQVTAPIRGRISRTLVTEGNLIASGPTGGTVLTNIVSVDPIYVYFDVDERTVLRIRQWVREGKAASARQGEWPVSLGLANEAGFPHHGTIDFLDNQVNAKTGTLRVRGVFPNKGEALSPGFFARVRLPIGSPYSALLVSDRAIDNDQGQKILYVVNDNNEVVSRPIRVGAVHDGLRVIEEGLKSGDRVVVNGLQQVQAGVTVEPKLVSMPASQATKHGGTHLVKAAP
ncbi:MAG: efflux RND transporter periplasmic adaptor subunit [Gemmataceae bacterium]|nr:efflux RND transporter periplasmic adaptor subunit [Gemmataceae bacterium]MCI0738978.1 efflux RND transporter periplasmic adaptor subunit [Gemmataceae bacterium]